MAIVKPLKMDASGLPGEVDTSDTFDADHLPMPMPVIFNAYTAGEYSPSATDGDNYRMLAFDDNGESVGVSLSQFLRSNFLTAEDAPQARTAIGLGSIATLNSIDLTANVTGQLPFANIADGSALSVLGRAANSTGVNASIAAGSDHQVLRRSGTSIAFGAVNLAQSAAVTGILAGANGGTNNAFMQFSGPASSTKTYTLPNASDTIACLGTAQTFTAAQVFNAGDLSNAVRIRGTTNAIRFNFSVANVTALEGTDQTGSGSFQRMAIGGSTLEFWNSGAEVGRIDSTRLQVAGSRVRIVTSHTPASAGATGTQGDIAWDSNFIYVCTATNTWKRVAIATW